MASPTRSFRSVRARWLVAVCAVVFVAAHFLGLAHVAAERTEFCHEHGRYEHADEASDRHELACAETHADHDSVRRAGAMPRVDASEHAGHHACGLAHLGTSPAGGFSAPRMARVGFADAHVTPCLGRRVVVSSIARLRLAPKLSPPFT